MPGERASMRDIREVLRLHLGQGLPQRVIVQSPRLGLGTVNGYVGRVRRAKLRWPLPDGLDDDRLKALLFPPLPGVPDGVGYSWFYDLDREWIGRLNPTLRQVHPAGELVFVDFAGRTTEVVDGAGSVELRLRACDLEPVAARLDRGACGRLRVFRRYRA